MTRKEVCFSPETRERCIALLENLMNEPEAWAFNTPVMPEAWGATDYFDIIKNPMDLGTVKSKLKSSAGYSSPTAFAEDVKLTFSNAMTYNPPFHWVHCKAEGLLELFQSKGNSLCEYLPHIQSAGNKLKKHAVSPPKTAMASQKNRGDSVKHPQTAKSALIAAAKAKKDSLLKKEHYKSLNRVTTLFLQLPERTPRVVCDFMEIHGCYSIDEHGFQLDLSVLGKEDLMQFEQLIRNYLNENKDKIYRGVREHIVVDEAADGTCKVSAQ